MSEYITNEERFNSNLKALDIEFLMAMANRPGFLGSNGLRAIVNILYIELEKSNIRGSKDAN